MLLPIEIGQAEPGQTKVPDLAGLPCWSEAYACVVIRPATYLLT